ncbi:MAG: hypothetical protein JXB49_03530 [Bacteroidales bacterium]|nr:hypothetical protein [Bacteroidales bacterium]
MKKSIAAGMVVAALFCSINLMAQKSNNEASEIGKIIAYTETGEVKMIVNKDMIDRFNSIEVDEDYITWNYLYSTYDWATIQFIVAAYHNNEVQITSKKDVERIAYVYQKTMETLFNANTNPAQPSSSVEVSTSLMSKTE